VLPPRDLLVNSLVAREKEAHGRPEDVLLANQICLSDYRVFFRREKVVFDCSVAF
jgi:hypothetical protein